VADAKAMGANPSNTIALLIPPVQWMKQVVESKKDALLAMENYLTVRKDADEWKLPVARDWTAIQLWSQLFSWEVE
jgi:thiamine monophosphate kinase